MNLEPVACTNIRHPVSKLITKIGAYHSNSNPPHYTVPAFLSSFIVSQLVWLLRHKLVPILHHYPGTNLIAVLTLVVAAKIKRSPNLCHLRVWYITYSYPRVRLPCKYTAGPYDILILTVVDLVDLIDIATSQVLSVKRSHTVEIQSFIGVDRNIP